MIFKNRTPRVTTRTVGAVAARITTPGSDHVRIETRTTPSGYQLVGLTVKGITISFTEKQAVNLINLVADAIDSFTPTSKGTPS